MLFSPLFCMLWAVKFTLRFNTNGDCRLVVHDNLQENCAIELLRVMRPIMGVFPRLSVLPFFKYSSTLNFVTFLML